MIAQALSALIPMRPSAVRDPTSDFWYSQPGVVSTSGIIVKPDTALAVSAVFGCVRLLREVLGSLPFRVYRRTGRDTKELAPDYPLWNLLHNKPNAWQTPMEWKEMGVAHLCLRGNFYCQKTVDQFGELQLIPLNPDRVTVEQLDDLSLLYTHRLSSGKIDRIRQREMYHVRGFSLNGIVGVSVIEFARNSVGSSIAQETYGSTLFRNGGLPTFWISRPAERKWSLDAKRNFRESWRKLHAGAENAGSPPILEDGMELHELGLTSRDSQWIESRGFGAEEICRFFGVSPHLIGVKTGAPLGSIEQQSIEFVTYTLEPLAVRFEQCANRDLVDEPDDYYTKIAMDALLRGDLLSRYQAHNIAIQGGWELVNEARALEDRNPIEGGDTPRYPLNMQPAGGGPDENEQGGQPGKGTPKRAQPPAETPEDDDDTAYKKRRATQQSIFAPLWEEAAQRIAAHEIGHLGTRAAKAAEDRGKWNAWASDFYQTKHRGYIAKTLDPIAGAWLDATGTECCPTGVADLLCATAEAVVTTSIDIAALFDRWNGDRASEVLLTIKGAFNAL